MTDAAGRLTKALTGRYAIERELAMAKLCVAGGLKMSSRGWTTAEAAARLSVAEATSQVSLLTDSRAASLLADSP